MMPNGGQMPMLVMTQKTQREHGRKAQLSNIAAARAVADIIRTTLGPRAMLKMILDPVGGINLTNDGNAILREVDVSHPAAKNMIELSRTQDEEVGDGTTSVILLASEFLKIAEPFLLKNMHPRILCAAYMKALDDTLEVIDKNAITLDTSDRALMLKILNSTLGTKFTSRYGDLIGNLALDAVECVRQKLENGTFEIDIKRYARVEKIPGGYLEDCAVLDGIMINKDVVDHNMRRRIENPRIVLLDCNLEYKKAESMMNIEISNEADFETILKQEEAYIEEVCNALIALKPDLVLTEKGVSDLAAHYLAKAGISVVRRLRKTDNNRIARAVGATISNDPRDLREEDIGTQCGLFEVRKIGDEYFMYLVKCKDPKACTILLRGASKDVLQEIDRNLQDAMSVARNIYTDPRVLPGGGATEMSISCALNKKSGLVDGVQQGPYRSLAQAFESIPRTLSENCGAKTIRLITELRSLHTTSEAEGDKEPGFCWGVDGLTGNVCDASKAAIWDPYLVKAQTYKTAVEAACMILRIDAIVSGMRSEASKKEQAKSAQDDEDDETFGDARDG